MTKRSADAVLFGIDFQINAAIVLALKNIKELKSLQLESDNEDIDIELNNGKHILAQAKAVVKSSTDFRNVRHNLKKALETLSEGSKNVPTKELILITNSPNPLNEEASRSIFYGVANRKFSSLPNSSQKIIMDYLKEIDNPLDIEQFRIQVIPFETDEDDERYKVVMQVINDFVFEIKLPNPGISRDLHEIWSNTIFLNGTKRDKTIKRSKNSLIWPIIVIVTDIDNFGTDFVDQYDSAQYDEIIRHYRETINSYCERVEYFTKILYDFSTYKNPGISKEKIHNFIEDNWQNYSEDLAIENIDNETLQILTKIIINSVLRRRYEIDRIKKGVNL